MKDITWYAVERDLLPKVMKGVVVERVTSDSVRYHRPKCKPTTINTPDEDELYLTAYGSMVMTGYVMVPSPDGKVHLCSGGDATYSVTTDTCTCPSSTYSKEGSCKHMHMLRGLEVYRYRAIALRYTALVPLKEVGS